MKKYESILPQLFAVCRRLIAGKEMCPVEQKDTIGAGLSTSSKGIEKKNPTDRAKVTMRQQTRFTKPNKASFNQDNLTPLPFTQYLSCLESLPVNVISTTMLGDLPMYSHNQACCLCTPRSFCSQSEMSPGDQTVTAVAPGVLKTFILHSDVIACEC